MLLRNKGLLGIIIKRNLILINDLNELILLIISKGIWFRFNMIIRNEILSLVIDLNKQLKDIIK